MNSTEPLWFPSVPRREVKKGRLERPVQTPEFIDGRGAEPLRDPADEGHELEKTKHRPISGVAVEADVPFRVEEHVDNMGSLVLWITFLDLHS